MENDNFEEPQDGQAPETTPQGEFVVRVIVKDIPGEVKTFGPMPEEDAIQLGADLQDGLVMVNFSLLPDAIDGIIVEKQGDGEGKGN